MMKNRIVRKRFVLAGVFVLLITIAAVYQANDTVRFGQESARLANHPDDLPPWDAFCPEDGDHAVTDALKPIRQKYRVPAMVGAIVTSKGLDVCGVVGVRRRGTDIPATLNDKWHLASDAKAMTATLVGRLVEQGLLKWNTTVADIFPDLASEFDPEMKGVTLLHLLSHRAGLPEDIYALDAWPSISDRAGLPRRLGSLDSWATIRLTSKTKTPPTTSEQRLLLASQVLAGKPKQSPGITYEYSNLGYVIVGAIVEKVTRMSWEEAIQQNVFNSLEMKTVGFGGTGTFGQIDQPWGHTVDGRPVVRNGPSSDCHPVLGPAGHVHCTIQDWAKFVTDQLRGARGEPALLKNPTYQVLHTPLFGGEYALGWIVVQRRWKGGGGTMLVHDGDNLTCHSTLWIAPQSDFAVLVCINQSGIDGSTEGPAQKASKEAVGALLNLHYDRSQGSEERH